MNVYLRAIPVVFMLAAIVFNGSYAFPAEHIMGHKLDVKDRPVNTPVISQVAMHTYPEAVDNNNKPYAWGALGGDTGGNVLNDTTTECANGKKCIDISTINYIMKEAPCIWPVKPYYAVVGICWNATNRGLYFTGKTVHNVKYYNIVEWWFGTYGLDDTSLCLTNTCRQGRELYGWSKCLKAVNNNYPWQARPEDRVMAAPNPRINLYNKYYGPHASGFRDENTWIRYLQDLVDLQINEKVPGISSEKRNRILAIHKNMLQRKDQLILTSENPAHYQQGLEGSLNNVLEECKKVFTDEEYKKFFGAEKREKFALPLEPAFR